MISNSQFKIFTTNKPKCWEFSFFLKFDAMICKVKDSSLITKSVPDDLGGEADPLPLLARGEGDRLSLPEGLIEASRWWPCLRGGVLDTRFIAFLGEGEPEELLPLDEAERVRLLLDKTCTDFYSF